MNPSCKINGCPREARYVRSGMCARHDRNMRVHGTPEAPLRQRTPQAELARAALARGMDQAVEVGDCLEWQGYYMCKGATPAVKAHSEKTGRSENLSAVRLLWEAKNGPIPDGKLIYRTCCNNRCVLHLACGTRKDWAKARKKAGTTKHSATAKIALTLAARRRANVKNTMEQARRVRVLAAGQLNTAQISELTGVHPTMVAEIRQGTAWRELGGNPFFGVGS